MFGFKRRNAALKALITRHEEELTRLRTRLEKLERSYTVCESCGCLVTSEKAKSGADTIRIVQEHAGFGLYVPRKVVHTPKYCFHCWADMEADRWGR